MDACKVSVNVMFSPGTYFICPSAGFMICSIPYIEKVLYEESNCPLYERTASSKEYPLLFTHVSYSSDVTKLSHSMKLNILCFHPEAVSVCSGRIMISTETKVKDPKRKSMYHSYLVGSHCNS